MLTLNRGWLVYSQKPDYAVRLTPSPFFNQRPQDASVDTLVIHNISLPPGEFGGDYIEALFTGHLDAMAHPALHDLDGLKVSAHALIRRCGMIQQFVAFDERAWHAGVSEFCGRHNCNDFSIGIELEGCDSVPYTQRQYHSLLALARLLCEHYAISTERITGHSDIAPERKTDPGPAFDWRYFKSMLVASSGA